MQIHEMRPTTVPPEIYDEERPGTAHLDKRTGIMNVKCKDNTWLAVNIVQMESKNEQNASRWWHGYRQGLESAIFDM